jgi:N-acetylmuramic acid 6-phosphate etherase
VLLLFLALEKAKLLPRDSLCATSRRYNSRMPTSRPARYSQTRRITEERNPASKNLDRWSSLEIVRLMNREDENVARAVRREIPAIARAVDAIVLRMNSGGRLIYVGAGTSGRLGILDASECPPTFGVSPNLVRGVIAGGRKAITKSIEGAEDRSADGARDLRKLHLTKQDAVAGIAASGTTPYVLGALAYARRRGALTIGLTADRRSPLAKAAHIAIAPEVGPEILAGSTRLKAGTSQKMVLNMLSTAVMVRLGHAYDNLMIDLGEANEKLRERAQWILMEASGKDASAVTRAMRQTGHDLRLALILLKRGVSAVQARRLLKQSGGNLRKALNE